MEEKKCLLDQAEELDMRLEDLGNLVNILGTYIAQEDDENNHAIGSALDFVAWSVKQVSEKYSKPMISSLINKNKDHVE